MQHTELKKEFEKIARITCDVRELPAPHKPNPLPKNMQGVYVFLAPLGCLKVGKAGQKSKARFNSHHYRANSTKSCLANSILADRSILKELFNSSMHAEIDALNKENIHFWLKQNTSRIEFTMSSIESKHALNFLEAFLQFKLNPVYEGKKRATTISKSAKK